MGYRNFVMRKKMKLFWYRVAEFFTLVYIFFVFMFLLVLGNVQEKSYEINGMCKMWESCRQCW